MLFLNQSRLYPLSVRSFLAAILCLLILQPVFADIRCPAVDDHKTTPYLGNWKGYVGDTPIELYLEPHSVDTERVQGHYVLLTQPKTEILVVGEQIKGFFEMEESVDGSNISGLWGISFPERATSTTECFYTLEGEWINAQYENQQPIKLQRQTSSW